LPVLQAGLLDPAGHPAGSMLHGLTGGSLFVPLYLVRHALELSGAESPWPYPHAVDPRLPLGGACSSRQTLFACFALPLISCQDVFQIGEVGVFSYEIGDT